MTWRREAGGLACLTLLASAIFLSAFREPLFSGDLDALMATSDGHTLNWPKAYLLDVRLREGEFPLWDPMLLNGTAYAAHPIAMAFYPPNLLRAILAQAETPQRFVYSMYAFALAHILVGSWGMYLWTRGEGIRVATSVVVALAVCFCERWFFNALIQTPLLCVVAWTPAVLVCLRAAVRQDSGRLRTGWALFAGSLYGFQILAGWPQAAIYCTILYVAYVILAILPAGLRFTRPDWRGLARSMRKAVAVCAVFGITGALIGCALILPARELMQESARSREHIGAYDVQTMLNAPPPVQFAWYFSKTEPGSVERVRELTAASQSSVSLNLALLAVSMSSLLLITRYRVFLHFLLAYLAFDLSYGPPMLLSRALERLAPFTLSTPWYQALLVSIPVATLAGFALDKILELGGRGRLPAPYLIVLVAAGAFLVSFGVDTTVPGREWSIARSVVPAGTLAVIVFGHALRHWRWIVIGITIVAITFDGWAVAAYTIRGTGTFMFRYSGDFDRLTRTPDTELRRPRVVCKTCNDHIWELERSINGYDPLIMHRTLQTLSRSGGKPIYNRAGSADGNLRVLAFLRRSFWLSPSYIRGRGPEHDRVTPPTAVVHLDADGPVGIPELQATEAPQGVVWSAADEVNLWAATLDGAAAQSTRAEFGPFDIPPRNSALRVYYAAPGDVEISLRAFGESSLQRFDTGGVMSTPGSGGRGVIDLPLPGFDQADAVVTLTANGTDSDARIERIVLIEDVADEIDRIRVVTSEANRVRVELRDLPAPRALLFTETAYPGWKATLDDNPVPILDANGAYQAVVVPAGTHEVEFVFRPFSVFAGVAITICALAVSAGLALFLFVTGEKNPERSKASGQTLSNGIGP